MFRGYVDPFDAGPSVEAYRQNIRSVRNARRYALAADNGVAADSPSYLIANTAVGTFRATVAPARLNADTDTLAVDAAVLRALELQSGDAVRAVAV